MKVYILTAVCYAVDGIECIYSTLEKAEEAKKRFVEEYQGKYPSKYNSEKDRAIIEYELDDDFSSKYAWEREVYVEYLENE